MIGLPRLGPSRSSVRGDTGGMRFVPHLLLALALAACGGDGDAVRHHERARAALLAGEILEAEEAVRLAREAGGAEVAPSCDFLDGNVAFARGLTAELQARTPEAEPFAFDIAIQYVEKARRLWESAAASRDDWPPARRNVERALVKLADLRRQKAERIRERQPPPPPRPNPVPEPPPDGDPETSEEEAEAKARRDELDAAGILALLERLDRKEREKRDLRREHRRSRTEDVERDW
jgi:hypothetical protein